MFFRLKLLVVRRIEKIPLQPAIESMQMSNQQLAQMLSMLMEKLSQPKTVIRGPDGKIAGVQ